MTTRPARITEVLPRRMVLASIVVYVICAAVVSVASRQVGDPPFGLLAALGLWVVAFFVSLNWRLGVYVILGYLTIEGAINMLLGPAGYPFDILAKDVIVLAAFAGFAWRVRTGRDSLEIPSAVLRPAIAFIAVTILESLNPLGSGALVSLVGIRVLVFYVPLFVLGYAMTKRKGTLAGLVRFVSIASIPVTGFGVFEYLVGPEAIIAVVPGFAGSVWWIVENNIDPVFRPTSTFSFVGLFGQFLLFVTILTFGALQSGAEHRWRILHGVAFCSALTGVVLQSQRTNWLLLPLAVLGIYVIAGRSRRALVSIPFLLAALGGAAIIGSRVLTLRLPNLFATGGERIVHHFDPMLAAFGRSTLLDALIGHGTGTALGAARHVTGDVPLAFELGWYQPFYMFGLAGLAIYVWLVASVLWFVWRGVRGASPSDRWIPASIFVYLILTWGLGGPANNSPTDIYVWVFSGAVAGLAGATRVFRLPGRSSFTPVPPNAVNVPAFGGTPPPV